MVPVGETDQPFLRKLVEQFLSNRAVEDGIHFLEIVEEEGRIENTEILSIPVNSPGPIIDISMVPPLQGRRHGRLAAQRSSWVELDGQLAAALLHPRSRQISWRRDRAPNSSDIHESELDGAFL